MAWQFKFYKLVYYASLLVIAFSIYASIDATFHKFPSPRDGKFYITIMLMALFLSTVFLTGKNKRLLIIATICPFLVIEIIMLTDFVIGWYCLDGSCKNVDGTDPPWQILSSVMFHIFLFINILAAWKGQNGSLSD